MDEIMWKIVCLISLYCGQHFLLRYWYNYNKDFKLDIIYLSLSSLFIIVNVFFIHIPTIFILLLTYIVYIIMSIIKHISIDFIFIPIIYTLSLFFLEFPLDTITKSYIQTYQYAFYSYICLLSLEYVLLQSNFMKIEMEWHKELDNYKNLLIILPISLFIISFITVCFSSQNLYLNIFFAFIIIIIYILVMKLHQTFIHLKYSIVINDLMNTWHKEARDYMNVIRSQRHDFNFHLHAVVGLIENEEFEECQQYVRNMSLEASTINDIMPIHDAVIGSMLYHMKEQAKAKGIDIEYNITYDLEYVLCNAFEINKILGNLIQNAIDAISNDEEKEYGIRVSILKRRGNAVIKVSNCFQGDKNVILHAYDLGYSTKKHHEGIGLSMISRTVEKYGGRIYTEFDDDIVSFIVNIPNLVHFEEGRHND